MAEVTSGDLTVIILAENEVNALQYLLENVNLSGTDDDENALSNAYSLLDAIDVEITV